MGVCFFRKWEFVLRKWEGFLKIRHYEASAWYADADASSAHQCLRSQASYSAAQVKGLGLYA